ncbi:major allergen I polypeptide chain 1-like [Notamacropus eugenii]|uniref:major allergen I polypeptide chain 1-like n=1 Tax=Notamacropus eugenii TaxID=9315 RepID=UPI003B684504
MPPHSQPILFLLNKKCPSTHSCIMKSVAVFMLFSDVAMLLEEAFDCTLCPPVTEDVFVFINGASEQYIDIMSKNTDNRAILKNARTLKACIDSKLTMEDKDAAVNLMKKINASVCSVDLQRMSIN